MKPNYTKWLVGLVLALAIINITLLVSVWRRQSGEVPVGGGPDGPRRILEMELRLDARQQEQFAALRREHMETIRAHRQQLGGLKDALFNGVKDPAFKADSVAAAIGAVEAEIDKATFIHFRKLRGICRSEQQVVFDEIIGEVARRMGPPPPGGEHPPK
jgi:periplasmic protein CpxP/Spy